MYKIFEKIAHIVLNIIILIIFLLVIIVGYNYVQLQILNKDYTNFFGYTVFEVTTGSMAKTLNVYDVIVVKITKEVEKGDIITFKQDEDLITHRIMEIDGDKIITKGDANNSEDTPVEMVQVLGKVEKIIPKIGIWKKVFMSPQMLGLISAFVAFLGIIINRFSKNNNIE